MPEKHTLEHALRPGGCSCDMIDITNCVICERRLAPDREQPDTCGEPHRKVLLAKQRERLRTV